MKALSALWAWIKSLFDIPEETDQEWVDRQW